MFDELVEVLGKFPSVVVERRHVSIGRHIFNAGGPKCGEGLEPVVLGDGAFSTDHARHLVQQAIHGAPFAIDDLGRVEVLCDHRRSYAQAMLAPDRGEEGNDALPLATARRCVCATARAWASCSTAAIGSMAITCPPLLALPRISLMWCFAGICTNASSARSSLPPKEPCAGASQNIPPCSSSSTASAVSPLRLSEAAMTIEPSRTGRAGWPLPDPQFA